MTDAEILAAFKLEKLPRDLLAPPVLWADEGFSKRQIRVLQAAVELGRRALTQAIPVPTKLSRSLDAARVMQPRLKGLIHEEFWVLVLNAALGLRAPPGGFGPGVDPRRAGHHDHAQPSFWRPDAERR